MGTDYETFKAMLTKAGKKFTELDWGTTITVHFEIEAGIAGSHTSCGFAGFRKDTGAFMGISHDD